MHSPDMSAALKTLERLVNQNAEDEIYSDYRYWEDASDVLYDPMLRCRRVRWHVSVVSMQQQQQHAVHPPPARDHYGSRSSLEISRVMFFSCASRVPPPISSSFASRHSRSTT